jgi:hypothetical protein
VPKNDRVRVEGVAEVQAALKSMELSARDLSAVHKRVVGALLPGIAQRSPRRTGALAGSYSARSTKTRGRIASSVVYSGVIEYGWAQHSIAPARMVRDTIEAEQATIVDTYQHELAELGKRADFTVVDS